jgi:hypothetical protein
MLETGKHDQEKRWWVAKPLPAEFRTLDIIESTQVVRPILANYWPMASALHRARWPQRGVLHSANVSAIADPG